MMVNGQMIFDMEKELRRLGMEIFTEVRRIY